MKRLLPALALLAGALTAHAQAPQPCDCAADLRAAQQTYERDYAGFADLRARRGPAAYQQLADSLRQASAAVHTAAACRSLLQRYLNYLDNGHVYLKPTAAFVAPPAAPGAPVRPARVLRPNLRVLDARTVLLTIPSADLRYRRAVDSLLTAHAATLARTPDLLIDVRGNGGGGDATFARVLPLLYTQPVVSHSAELWSTPANTAMFRELLTNPDLPAESRSYVATLVARMEAAPNTFVAMSAQRTDTTRLPQVQPFPRRVGILVDHGCASSTEEFLLAARQSRKVTLFGRQNTAGALDYANVRMVALPSGLFEVGVPTTRSTRLPEHPFDPVGLKPDVPVPARETDWVQFVRHYWQPRKS